MKRLVKCCGPLKVLQLEIINAKVLQQCQRCLTFVWIILTGGVCVVLRLGISLYLKFKRLIPWFGCWQNLDPRHMPLEVDD